MQHAVLNNSSLEDIDVALAVEAVNQQSIECAKLYDVEPIVAVFYSDAAGLPQSDCRIVDIVDDLEMRGVSGFHNDVAGIIYSRLQAGASIDEMTVTLSHEILEMTVDARCDEWRPMGGGRLCALEVADPVEGDSYAVTVTVVGLERRVKLSNYVLPRFFDPAALGAIDFMRVLASPFSMSPGGYMIVRDAAGNESNVFARIRFGGESGRYAVGGKAANPDSRLARRLRRK